MGFGLHLRNRDGISDRERGQNCVCFFLALCTLVVLALLVGLEEPALAQDCSRRTQCGFLESGALHRGKRSCLNRDGDGFPLSVHHLAGHGPLPNQVIQLELIRAQHRSKITRGRESVAGRANRLVSFLRVFGFALIEARFARNRARTIERLGCSASCGDRLC